MDATTVESRNWTPRGRAFDPASAARAFCVLAVSLVLARATSAEELPTVAEINAAMSAYTACGKRYVAASAIASLEAAKAACAPRLDAYAALMYRFALGTQLSEGRKPSAAEDYARLKERTSRKDAIAFFSSQYEVWTGQR